MSSSTPQTESEEVREDKSIGSDGQTLETLSEVEGEGESESGSQGGSQGGDVLRPEEEAKAAPPESTPASSTPKETKNQKSEVRGLPGAARVACPLLSPQGLYMPHLTANSLRVRRAGSEGRALFPSGPSSNVRSV